jgi:hypothetical protein
MADWARTLALAPNLAKASTRLRLAMKGLLPG